MIFAYITNTLCVALPNLNGKVEGVYKWIENKGTVVFEKKFMGDFNFKYKVSQELSKEFDTLRKKVHSFIDKE